MTSSVMKRGAGIKTVDLLLPAHFILHASSAANKRKLIQQVRLTLFKPIPRLCIRLLHVRSRFDFIHLEENTFLHLQYFGTAFLESYTRLII